MQANSKQLLAQHRAELGEKDARITELVANTPTDTKAKASGPKARISPVTITP